ncbi:four-domain proteases inhibitor-like [Xenia sp. Carnegie-2017]|uniref:four-domain proteases inhibitor-like n=1 Tax=Xenia sp. Carnegie-2017 TaxID=2897299 RepID=UPI001F0455E2|nr:four-domain proteases inhibitor-like [Xenia sp. Carnegie-2017]
MKFAIFVLSTYLTVFMVIPVLSRQRVKRGNHCNTACIEIYAPVCGSNGVTYSNDCLLEAANCSNVCENITIAHRGRCDCKLQAVAGPCEALIPRYYFDENKAKCLQFAYGGCGGNRNNFETQQDCALNCPSAIASPYGK